MPVWWAIGLDGEGEVTVWGCRSARRAPRGVGWRRRCRCPDTCTAAPRNATAPRELEAADRNSGELAQGFAEDSPVRETEVRSDAVEGRDPVIEQSGRDEETQRREESSRRGPASQDKAAV